MNGNSGLLVTPGVALVAGLLTTGGACVWVDRQVEVAEQARFARRVQAHLAAIQRAVDANRVMVDAVAGLFRASDRVDPEEFRAFTATRALRRSAVIAVEWAPVVPGDAVAAWHARRAAAGLPPLGITARDASGAMIPAPPAPFHVPVVYAEPIVGNEAALGFDLASESARRGTLEAARDAGRALSTPMVRLVQEDHGGFLVLQPVYAVEPPPADVAGRRAALLGFVVGVVKLDDLVTDALADVAGGNLRVEVLPGEGEAQVLFAAETVGDAVRAAVGGPSPVHARSAELVLEVPGPPLRVRFVALEEPGAPTTLPVVAALVVGLALTGGAVSWLYGSARTRVTLQARVAERTEALTATADRLRAESAERERAERAERRARQRLEALLHHFPGAGWTTDGALRLTSAAGARLVALGLEGRDGLRLDEAWGDGHPLRPLARAHLRAAAGEPVSVDVEVDGMAFEVWVEPAGDAPGEGTIAVALDVTERRRLEAQRVEAALLRAQKLESLGLLAGGIAHDFNNLLVGVLGNASLLTARLPEGSPDHAAAARIEAAATQAATLTRQMLAYSGRGHFVVEPIDLGATVRELADLVAASLAGRVELAYELGEGLPPVRADVAQVRQLFLNLVTNAADAVGDAGGRVVIRTAVETLDAARLAATLLGEGLVPGRYVRLEVQDDGEGMEPETVRRMFDPFFTTKAEGHGLGLAAALGILRGHRGTVEVQSRRGEGTTIRTWFPASAEAVAPGPGPARTDAGSGPRGVMVVDDEPLVRALVADALQSRGDRVATFPDGPSALAAFAADPAAWDVVVLDLTMPGMNGPEVYRRLRAVRADLPVLLVSGYSESDAMGGLPAAAGFLQKPFTVEQLRAAVDAAAGVSAPRW